MILDFSQLSMTPLTIPDDFGFLPTIHDSNDIDVQAILVIFLFLTYYLPIYFDNSIVRRRRFKLWTSQLEI